LKFVFSAAGVMLSEGSGHRMKTHRIFVAGIMAVCLSADAALAQDWPTRPITLVVPFGAGGSSDVIGRVVAEGLRVQLGQPVMQD
jgi:tripartite-type tricarboxylate transporter receptor subunit TctC